MNNEFRIKNMIADNILYQLEQQNKETLKIYYANLEQENKKLKDKIDKAREYINTTDKWLCRVNDNLCVETIGKDKLLEILGDEE